MCSSINKHTICAIFLSVFTSQASVANDVCTEPLVNAVASWYPHYYRSEDTLSGPAIDHATAVLSKIGAKPVFDSQKPQRRIERDLAQGRLDMVIMANYSEDRNEKYLLSIPIHIESRGLIRLKGVEEKTYDQSTVGVFRSIRAFTPMSKLNKVFQNTITLEMSDKIFKLLTDNRIDYVYLNHNSIPDLAKQYGNQPSDWETVDYLATSSSTHFMISKSSPCAQKIDAINAALVATPYTTK